MKRLTVLAIILLSTATAACIAGKDGAQGPAGPPGTAPEGAGAGAPPAPPAGGGGASSGGASSSGGTSSGGTPPPAASKTGTIMVTQMSFTVADTPINSYSAFASFVDATGVVAPAGGSKCTTTKDGDCDVTLCDIATVAGSDGTPPPADPKKQPSASDITITGAEEITLSADDKGAYTPKTGQTALFAGGDDLKIKAKGAEVPAFDKTVKAPSIINVTAPDWPAAGDAFAVDRTADLQLTWENGTAGDVQASITATTDKKSTIVSCKFKATAGTGKITKSALGKLVVSDKGSISISNTSTQAFDQGGWKINLTASSPATVAAGGVASGLANIQ